MNELAEDMVTFIADATPEVSVSDIDGWSEETRDIDDIVACLVKLDPTVADMTYDQFCEAVERSGEDTPFEQLVEVHDRGQTKDAVFRVTGKRVDNAPRYFLDAPSATLVVHGAYSRDNIAVALLDEDAFAPSAYKYINAYRLFTPDGRENRADEIRHANSFLDRLRSEALNEEIDELREESNGGLDDYFAEYVDESDDTAGDEDGGLDDLF